MFQSCTGAWSRADQPLFAGPGKKPRTDSLFANQWPSARTGSTMVHVDDHLILYGGSDEVACVGDVWTLKTANGKLDPHWKKWRIENQPGPRVGHTLTRTNFIDDKRIFLFGGQDVNSQTYFNDLWVMNAEYRTDYNRSLEWEVVYPAGETPCPRWNHATAYVDNYLFIYGGEDRDLNTLHDMRIYSIESNQWIYTRPFLPYPPARQLHTLSNVDNHLVAIGGRGGVRHAHLSDVWIFDTEVMRWLELPIRGSVNPFLDNGIVRGLEGHSAVVIDRNKVLISGGRRGSGLNNETWILDLVSHQWAKVDTPENTTVKPFNRQRHTTCLDTSCPSRMYVFGGAGDMTKYNDLWMLDTTITKHDLSSTVREGGSGGVIETSPRGNGKGEGVGDSGDGAVEG